MLAVSLWRGAQLEHTAKMEGALSCDLNLRLLRSYFKCSPVRLALKSCTLNKTIMDAAKFHFFRKPDEEARSVIRSCLRTPQKQTAVLGVLQIGVK